MVLALDRIIFLVDMNAFFISCEMARRPELSGKPAAVAGDPKKRTGIILAANYDARKFGVKTAMTLNEALKLCPHMLLVPPDHDYYSAMSRQVMALLSDYSPLLEQNSIDEAWLDMTGSDTLLGSPLKIASRIMEEIRSNLGLFCSIGIAESKFISKMASEMKKPMGITALWNRDIPEKLWPLPVRSMYGVGGKTAEKLGRLGIETIGQLASFSREKLIENLGKAGEELHDHANGLDPSPVSPHREGEMKSVGRSVTLPEDITDPQQARLILLELSDDIGTTARSHGKKGRTVQITLKYTDFKVVTRQTTVPPTCTSREIYEAGWELLKRHWNLHRAVRLIGITLSGFEDESEVQQLSLFDFGSVESTPEVRGKKKLEELDRALDEIRSRHGYDSINRAVLFKKKAPPPPDNQH